MTDAHDHTDDPDGVLHGPSVPLKIWLPELAEAMLEAEAARHGLTRSAVIIRALFGYLYGEPELERQIARTAPFVTQRPQHVESRSPRYRPELGKNIADVRLLVPARIRDDLERLAARDGLKVSAFVRRILVDRWFGHVSMNDDEPA
ncbi:MAG: hypothetical protein KIT73_03715 [Burkholderiales bacterium]|nr:hypothetical protein [Burkholderiales bacterium]